MTEQNKSASVLALKSIKDSLKNDAMIVLHFFGIPDSGKSILSNLLRRLKKKFSTSEFVWDTDKVLTLVDDYGYFSIQHCEVLRNRNGEILAYYYEGHI